MKSIITCLVFCVFSSLARTDDLIPTPLMDAKPGQYGKGEAVLVILRDAGIHTEYGLVIRAGGTFRVLPVQVEAKIPPGALGRPCLIEARVWDDTPNDSMPRKLVWQVWDIKPITPKR